MKIKSKQVQQSYSPNILLAKKYQLDAESYDQSDHEISCDIGKGSWEKKIRSEHGCLTFEYSSIGIEIIREFG